MNQGDTKHLKWLHDRFVNVYNENENVDFLIKFRNIIKELEEAMKPKTCDGCKFKNTVKFVQVEDETFECCSVCVRKYYDYFEPKDNE